MDQRSVTIARAVFSEWIACFCAPERIHSDRGAQFESALFEELCDAFGVDRTRMTPYQPQTSEKVEHFNRTLVSMLRRSVKKRPYYRELLLPAVLQAYQTTPNESTGFTPFYMVFGREMRLPIDVLTALPEPSRDVRTYANLLCGDLCWAYCVARKVTGLANRRFAACYNERVVVMLYSPSTLVRVIQRTFFSNALTKLSQNFSGLCKNLNIQGPALTLRKLDI